MAERFYRTLGAFTPSPPTASMETHTQRSAVAALIGRCEGLIWDRKIMSEVERVRLFGLLTETCAAFDMAPPKFEKESV